MFLEIALLSLLLPSKNAADEKYALLHEVAEQKGWRVVRCSLRKARTLFLSCEVYKVTADERDYLVSIEDGNTHLHNLLRAGLVDTAKTLLVEAQIK